MSNQLNLRGRIIELEGIHGGLRAVARVLQIDPAYLSRLKAGQKCNPSGRMLKKLGMKKITAYIRTTPAIPADGGAE